MSDTTDFADAPKAFLQTKAIFVPDRTDEALRKVTDDTAKFRLVSIAGVASSFWLELAPDSERDAIAAYYLPWDKGLAPVKVLGTKTKFFFTSHMSNCGFKIVDDNPVAPKVAHIAGNEGPGFVLRKENELMGLKGDASRRPTPIPSASAAKFAVTPPGVPVLGPPPPFPSGPPSAPPPPPVSGASVPPPPPLLGPGPPPPPGLHAPRPAAGVPMFDPKKGSFNPSEKKEAHTYLGQAGARHTYAFVFGHREEHWKFYAQITAGALMVDGKGIDFPNPVSVERQPSGKYFYRIR